jgi:hypothetical protein
MEANLGVVTGTQTIGVEHVDLAIAVVIDTVTAKVEVALAGRLSTGLPACRAVGRRTTDTSS